MKLIAFTWIFEGGGFFFFGIINDARSGDLLKRFHRGGLYVPLKIFFVNFKSVEDAISEKNRNAQSCRLFHGM